MHEYPLTLEIIRLAEKAAKEKDAGKVTRIALVIGDLSGYAGDSIRMYFDEISKGTMCEGCELTIQRVLPQMQCGVCKEVFERKPFSFDCPYCGGAACPTRTASEFYIDYIEAET